ncbi:hypothetical protein BCS96_01930 [Vibrio breoganii]|nr:hypothetical protein BCT68_17380 [Vibrio breoganii]PMO60596.1 hypothetical protein BCT04_18260 [Vibrio breoganii]PMO97278.1 hypothetical protein BCS96_01930 [Vibrio breoganii]
MSQPVGRPVPVLQGEPNSEKPHYESIAVFFRLHFVNGRYVTTGWPARASLAGGAKFQTKPYHENDAVFFRLHFVNDGYVATGWPARSSLAGGAKFRETALRKYCGFFTSALCERWICHNRMAGPYKSCRGSQISKKPYHENDAVFFRLYFAPQPKNNRHSRMSLAGI